MSGVTVVLGASEKGHRYSNLAVRRLVAAGFPVVAIGRRAGHIGDVPILTELPEGTEVDTVTLYLSEENQRPWVDRILAWRPRRVIFNPGAEHPALERRLEQQGVRVLEACTLVMISTGEYAGQTPRLG